MTKKDDGKVGAGTVAGWMKEDKEGDREQANLMIRTLSDRLDARDVADASAGRWRTFERLTLFAIIAGLGGLNVYQKITTEGIQTTITQPIGETP